MTQRSLSGLRKSSSKKSHHCQTRARGFAAWQGQWALNELLLLPSLPRNDQVRGYFRAQKRSNITIKHDCMCLATHWGRYVFFSGVCACRGCLSTAIEAGAPPRTPGTPLHISLKFVKAPHTDLHSRKFRLVQRPPTTLLSAPNFAGGARGGWSPVSSIAQSTVCLLINAAEISTSTGRSRMCRNVQLTSTGWFSL